VKARQYTDSKCLWHSKPLLESGTTGTKSNHEVILPYRTGTYNDGEDPPEVAIAMCTLRSFPYLPLHCIEVGPAHASNAHTETTTLPPHAPSPLPSATTPSHMPPPSLSQFAKQKLYTETFEFGPEQYEKFRTDKEGFFASLESMAKEEERMSAMQLVKGMIDLQVEHALLLTAIALLTVPLFPPLLSTPPFHPSFPPLLPPLRPKRDARGRVSLVISFATCIQLAFSQLVEVFRNKILDVRHGGDQEEQKEGTPYWTGTKRRPNPVEFSTDDALCMEYLYATANMYAFTFEVEQIRDRADFAGSVKAMVREGDLKQTEWKASGASKVEAEDDEGDKVDPKDKAALIEALQEVEGEDLIRAIPHDFEKDDDENFHIDYLTIASNLRAWNYNITQTERHAVKVTAGRIIPALATTTAMVCGLVDNEFCKLVLGLQNLGNDQFLNSNINLATGSGNMTVFNPQPPTEESNLKKTGECIVSA
jgi:ubiquitin-activating enzyme E1